MQFQTGKTYTTRSLIAAAPELLAALQQMIEVFLDTNGSFGAEETEAMETARAAIAKATGEKS